MSIPELSCLLLVHTARYASKTDPRHYKAQTLTITSRSDTKSRTSKHSFDANTLPTYLSATPSTPHLNLPPEKQDHISPSRNPIHLYHQTPSTPLMSSIQCEKGRL